MAREMVKWAKRRTMSHTVVSSILLACDESLGVEEGAVDTGPDLVDDVGLEVDVERAGHVLAGRGFREESAEAIVVGGGRALNKTTIGLWLGLDEEMECKRVETHAKTVLDGVEFPCIHNS